MEMEQRKCHKCGGPMVPSEQRTRTSMLGLVNTSLTVFSCLHCGTRTNILGTGTQYVQIVGGIALIAFGLWSGEYGMAGVGALLILLAGLVPLRNPVMHDDEVAAANAHARVTRGQQAEPGEVLDRAMSAAIAQRQTQSGRGSVPQSRLQAQRQSGVQRQGGFGRRAGR